MDRLSIVRGFAAAAVTVLAVHIVDRYGYDSVRGLLILIGLAAVSALAIDVSLTGGIAAGLIVFYLADRLLQDAFSAAWVVAVIALVLLLAMRSGGLGGRR